MARGRPISFDQTDVLERILHVFWRDGYIGASYSGLCAATSLTKPSLYAAFGNKEETFLTALEHYLDQFIRPGVIMLEKEPDLRKGIHTLLVDTVNGLTAEGTPPGCMVASNAACAHAPEVPERVAHALLAGVKETPNGIKKRLMSADPGDLPPGSDPAALSLLFEMVVSGLSGMARQGTPRADLLAIVDCAMLIWPE